MKITIYQRKISSIEVEVETPYELRALYILLQLIAQEEFKIVKFGMGSFDGLPGLGKYCLEDVSQNPIRRLYELLQGNGNIPTDKNDAAIIILACKKAIHRYNQKLLELFTSELMNVSSDYRLPTSLLIKATSKNKPLTQNEFMNDNQIKWGHFLQQAWKQKIYDSYTQHQDLIASFAPIDASKAANITGLIDAFKDLSQTILDDEYVHNDEVHLEGMQLKWNDTHIQPSMFGSLTSIGVGLSAATAKSVYDAILKPVTMSNNLVLGIAIDNGINLLSMLSTLLSNRRATQFKESRDNALMLAAVESLADKFPEYKKLLIEKGFSYTTIEITYVDGPPPNEAAPAEASSASRGFFR